MFHTRTGKKRRFWESRYPLQTKISLLKINTGYFFHVQIKMYPNWFDCEDSQTSFRITITTVYWFPGNGSFLEVLHQAYIFLILLEQDSIYNWYNIQVTRQNSNPIISARLQRSNRKPSNNLQVSLAATIMTSG